MPRARPRPPSRSTGPVPQAHPRSWRPPGRRAAAAPPNLVASGWGSRGRRTWAPPGRSWRGPRAPLVEPGMPVHGASFGGDGGVALPSEPEPEDAVWRRRSSQSAVCAWVEGMRGASRSSRRRGQILSGWVPDIGSCWLSQAGIAAGSTITVGQRAVCFPDGQFFAARPHSGRRPVGPADAPASLLLTAGLAPQQIPPGVGARAASWPVRVA